jgi:hypothetical protein
VQEKAATKDGLHQTEAVLRKEIQDVKVDLLKWSFAFWVGAVAVLSVYLLVCLSAIVNTVNPHCVRPVQIEEQTPFPHPKPVQSVAVRQHLDVSFARVCVARESEQDSHRRFSVQLPQLGA